MKRLISCFLMTIILALALTGCSKSNNDPDIKLDLTENSDFVGKKFAIETGSAYAEVLDEYLGDNELLYFNTISECVEAVKTNKADATISDEPLLRKFVIKNPELTLITPLLTQEEYGLIISKDRPELTKNLNNFYDEIKADGTYDEMVARWLDSEDVPDLPIIPLSGKNGTLKMATSAINQPFGFYAANNEFSGFDIEYAIRFAQYMDMDIEFFDMDFSGIIPSVQSGKTDFGASLMTITQERAKSIDFTKPYYTGGGAILTRQTSGKLELPKVSFVEGFKDSFNQNLIVEDRYKMIFSGLWVTIVISIFSLILGTILGFIIYFLTVSQYNVLNWISKTYTMILRGTPMVVLLMITFYIIFSKVDISPVIVAIIAFGLNGGAFIGEIIRSSIDNVDKGQIEAARSMGFSASGAFMTVTLPQAVRMALPLYKSEFISMMKQTAIVGYIAIVDLTKVGDIIRSKTYDAFFPLIVVAVVYLVTIGFFIWLFDLVYRLTDKRQRSVR